MNRINLFKELIQTEEGKKLAKRDTDREGNYVSHIAAAFDNLDVL